MTRKVSFFLVVGLCSLSFPILAQARSSYLSSFNSQYGTSGTALNTCSLCHPGGNTGSQNQFARDFASASIGNHTFNAALEGRDSDGDGFTNIAEINARTFPGDANSKPASSADTTAPSVTGFTIPATSSSLTISISTLTATDNIGVTGYIITESSTAPAASAAGWTAAAPTSYSFTTAGAKTLYAWAKDAASNVSASRSATTTITLSDTTAPSVTGFTIPATSSSLTISISTLTATDNIGVTGYTVTESATAPSASAAGWTATAPTGFTFATTGAKTLYAWAKDAAGNVSTSRSAATTITSSDTVAPTITVFNIPATASRPDISVTLAATDNVGVTGYMVSESAATPSSSSPGWSATPPYTFVFTSSGPKTLYAWAKDAAGNVSARASDTTTIYLTDTTPPTVTGFTIPATSSSLTVSITRFTASDNMAVTGYLATESASTPASSAPGWSASAPISFIFTTPGSKVLYAWAKDSAGNVSSSLSATVTITLAPDTQAPVVTSFLVPGSSNSLVVPIQALAATDNIAVAGFMVTESSTTPAASSTAWTTAAPASYGFSTAGTKVLYAWAKDAAGNVSAARNATVTITLPPPPAGTSDKIGVFRNGLWMLDVTGNGQFELPGDKNFTFGSSADLPVVGDWDGTGRTRVGTFNNGLWSLDLNGSDSWDGTPQDAQISLGQAGDIPVVGDWNGTRFSKIGTFRAGVWTLDWAGSSVSSGAPTIQVLNFGQAGDIPVVGDWNGTGRTKVGVFRQGTWYLDMNGDGVFDPALDLTLQFGKPGDVPVVGDWNHDGVADIGIFRNGAWALDMNDDDLFGLSVDALFAFGMAGDIPVVGSW